MQPRHYPWPDWVRLYMLALVDFWSRARSAAALPSIDITAKSGRLSILIPVGSIPTGCANTEGHLDDDVKLLSAHEARQRLKTIDRQLGRA